MSFFTLNTEYIDFKYENKKYPTRLFIFALELEITIDTVEGFPVDRKQRIRDSVPLSQ